jgi:hypothetical protein
MAETYEWPSVFTFEWAKDAAGYELQGGRILRRGGAMTTYVPDESASIHREFLALALGDNDAYLAFVEKYGFLGSVHGGADAEHETVSSIALQASNLEIFARHVQDDASVSDEERAETFNNFAPAHMTVRMEKSRGGKMRLRVAPRSLIAWLWLRMANETAGDVVDRICAYPGCGKSFPVGSHHGTSRKKYCSDSCRALHHQQRALETKSTKTAVSK